MGKSPKDDLDLKSPFLYKEVKSNLLGEFCSLSDAILTSICGLPKAVTLIAAKPSLDAPPNGNSHEIKLVLNNFS